MENFSPISALIGGFITAVFSFFVWMIRHASIKKSERKRVAFFYFVKISEILALKKAVEFTFREEIKELKKELENNKYLAYQLCVVISDQLISKSKNLNDDEKSSFRSFVPYMKQIDARMDDYLDYKADIGVISRFPKSAILHYHFFIRYLNELRSNISSWIIAFEQLDFTLFSPDTLYDQIQSTINLIESSEMLVNTLTKESGIKRDEANRIMTKQYKVFATKLATDKYNKKIINIFEETYNKAKLSAKQGAGERCS